jgi:pilus assembly protein Flp/PilA
MPLRRLRPDNRDAIMTLLRKLIADQTGASSAEYAFIASLISIAALVGIQGLGAEVGESYDTTAQAVKDATP